MEVLISAKQALHLCVKIKNTHQRLYNTVALNSTVNQFGHRKSRILNNSYKKSIVGKIAVFLIKLDVRKEL